MSRKMSHPDVENGHRRRHLFEQESDCHLHAHIWKFELYSILNNTWASSGKYVYISQRQSRTLSFSYNMAEVGVKTFGVSTKRLTHEGYTYSVKKTGKTRKNYRCINWSRFECRGSISSDLDGKDIRLGLGHCHPPPDVTRDKIDSKLHNLKLVAKNTMDNPTALVKSVLATCTEEDSVYLPQEKTLKRLVQKMRPQPENPKDVHFVVSIIFYEHLFLLYYTLFLL